MCSMFEVSMRLNCLIISFFTYFINQVFTFSCINPDPSKYYTIVNVRSNLVLGVNGNSLSNNAAIWQQNDSAFLSQLWSFQIVNAAAQTVKIINSYSGLALTSQPNKNYPTPSCQTTLDPNRTDQIFQIVQGPNGCYIKVYPFTNYLTPDSCSLNETQIETWTYWENVTNVVCTNGQQFVYNEATSCTQPNPAKYYKIRNVRSQFVLGPDGGSTSINSNISQDKDYGLYSQLWSFQVVNATGQTYKIVNVKNGLVFTMAGQILQTALDPTRTDQIFKLVQGPRGCYIKLYPFTSYVTVYSCLSTTTFTGAYWYCENTYNYVRCQQYTLEPTSCVLPNTSLYYKIVNVRSKLILGVNGASTASDAEIWQDYDNGYHSQLWSFQLLDIKNQTYKIINSYTGMAFSSPPTASGVPSYQAPLDPSLTDQIFQVFAGPDGCYVKPYPFTSYLTINFCSLSPNKTETLNYWEDQNSAYCTPNCSNCQQFAFTATTSCFLPDPTKYYKIVNVMSRLVLGVFINDTLKNNSEVWQLTDTGSSAQLWSFQPVNVQNRTYNIINSQSNLALTSPNGYVNGLLSFQMSLDSTRPDQTFQLVQASAGCYLKIPASNQYLTISYCVQTPNGVISWPYTETVTNFTYCQQFTVIEATAIPVDPAVVLMAAAVQTILGESESGSVPRLSEVASVIPYALTTLSESEKMQLGNTLNETVKLCFFDGNPCNMQRDFNTIYDASLDSCFTFNYPTDASIYAVTGVGAKHGLEMILYDPSEESLCTTMSTGFKVHVHNSSLYPFMDNIGFNVPPGFVTTFILSKESSVRLPAPYGTCIPNKDSSYLYRGSYTTEGCYRSCYAWSVSKGCGCSDPSYPLPNGSTYCDVSKRGCVDYYAQCKKDEITSSCTCGYPCNDETFTASITKNQIFASPFVIRYCLSRPNISFDQCMEHARKSFAIMNIYFQTTKVVSYEESASYTIQNFWNDFSNVLGVLVGVDVTIVPELLLFGFFMVQLFF